MHLQEHESAEREEHSEPLLAASWQSENKERVDAIRRGEVHPNGVSQDKYSEVQHMLEEEQRCAPPGTVAILVGLFSWLLVTGVLKDVVACGGAAYWLLVLSAIPLVAAIMSVVRNKLIRKGALKREVRCVCGLLRLACNERSTPLRLVSSTRDVFVCTAVSACLARKRSQPLENVTAMFLRASRTFRR